MMVYGQRKAVVSVCNTRLKKGTLHLIRSLASMRRGHFTDRIKYCGTPGQIEHNIGIPITMSMRPLALAGDLGLLWKVNFILLCSEWVEATREVCGKGLGGWLCLYSNTDRCSEIRTSKNGRWRLLAKLLFDPENLIQLG